MTNTELEQIVDTIRTGFQLRSESIAAHIKLLRSIEIAALREVRELVEKQTIWAADHETEEPVNIPNPALPELDRLIRNLELK